MAWEVVYTILLIVGFHMLLMVFALVLYGVYVLGCALGLQLCQLFTTLSFWRRSARQIREVQSIGHRARREMQQLYTSYMAQVRTPKGG